MLEWPRAGGASISSYRYGLQSKNTLDIDHYIGSVLSDSIGLEFSRVRDVEDCLGCLPRGREMVEELRAAAKSAPVKRE